LIRFPFFDIILFIDEKGNQMNSLLKAMMKRDSLSKEEAIEIIMEEFEAQSMDGEETLYALGFELDYAFDLMDIVANN